MIRINLLAEEIAALEMKRRDPVKRALWGAAFCVSLFLIWVLTLQAKVMQANGELEGAQAQWKRIEKQDAMVKTNLVRTGDMERRLAALAQLSANRFLASRVLNALQFCVVERIQLTEMDFNLSYTLVPAKTDATGKKITSPATSVERFSLTLRGDDFAPDSEGNHTRFMDAIARNPFFQKNLKRPDPFRSVERVRSAGTAQGSRRTGTFSFECQFPDKTR